MHSTPLTRRDLLKATGNIVALSALTPLLARRAGAAVTPITVGFIYAATRQDYGWNQAHAVAARKIAQLKVSSLSSRRRCRRRRKSRRSWKA